MRTRTTSSIGIVLVTMTLLAASCGIDTANTNTPTTTNTNQSANANTNNTNAPTNGDAMSPKTFTVDGSNFKFSPAEIRVKRGDTVTINFRNTGGFHDFVIDEFNVKTKQINGGASENVTFTADKTGTFEYYCSVGQHRQMGMVGKLIVE